MVSKLSYLLNIRLVQKFLHQFAMSLKLNPPWSANAQKWLNALKQSVGNSQQIVYVSLTIFWGWRLKGYGTIKLCKKSLPLFCNMSSTFKWLFIPPLHCDTFGIHNPIELRLLARLGMGLSYLNEHKFKHNFCEFLNPLWACNLELETTSHYLLRYYLLQKERRTLLNDIKKLDENIITDHKNDSGKEFLWLYLPEITSTVIYLNKDHTDKPKQLLH